MAEAVCWVVKWQDAKGIWQRREFPLDDTGRDRAQAEHDAIKAECERCKQIEVPGPSLPDMVVSVVVPTKQPQESDEDKPNRPRGKDYMRR